jgi:hypothetical protein
MAKLLKDKGNGGGGGGGGTSFIKPIYCSRNGNDCRGIVIDVVYKLRWE